MARDSHRLRAHMLAILSILSLLSLATAISILTTNDSGSSPTFTSASLSEGGSQVGLSQPDNSLPSPPTDANGNPLPPEGLPTSWNTDPQSATLPPGSNPTNEFGCNGSDTFTTSRDGDPYPVCPGPMPTSGGNCTWWVWQSWHRLGLNLPGWGNAALWANAAEGAGFQVGTVPRVNAIAVFPVGDGVWAFSSAGHVAFVTQVYSDHDTFDVTYQNYGDPTTEHFGYHYRVSLIQQARYQNGQLRFIYFPDSNGGPKPPPTPPPPTAPPSPPPAPPQATPSPTASPGSGSPGASTSPDLYTGNFAGDDRREVLRYNRATGAIDLLALSADGSSIHVVPLSDHLTPAGGWGSAWEVSIGDLTGEGRDTLLLFDRVHAIGRFIRLNPDLSVGSDVEHTGWSSSWELVIGRFGNAHDDLLIYDRHLDQDHGQWTSTPGEGNNGSGSSNPGPADWQHLHRTATLRLVDYNLNFSIHQEVEFDHWHNTWEIQPGHFGSEQNGLLLFDHQAGEARIMIFTTQMQIAQTYSASHWNTRWEPFIDDFTGTGQDSLLLYDRSSGTVRLLAFTPTLQLARTAMYTGWAPGWDVYTGHWGGAAQNAAELFLYDPKQGRAAFVSFGPHLEIANQKMYEGWHHTWTVFVGQFLTSCNAVANAPCLSTILLADTQAGKAKVVQFHFADGTSNQDVQYSETAIAWPG